MNIVYDNGDIYHPFLIYSLALRKDSKCFWTSLSRIFDASIDESTEFIVFYLSCSLYLRYFSKSSCSCFAFFFCRIWMFYISSFSPFSFWEVSLYLSFAATIYYRIACYSGSSDSFPETKSFTAFYRLSSYNLFLSRPIFYLDWWISVANYFPIFIFYLKTSAFFLIA